MNLVSYSDSEDSENEAKPLPAPKTLPSGSASKPTFQRVVDRSNPHKIKVNLPTASSSVAANDELEAEAPPAKKTKVGGGTFSGFNSLLPAPKKSGSGAGPILSRGLGRGVNLKTGAAPAFSREPVAEIFSQPAEGEDDATTKNVNVDEAGQNDLATEPAAEKEVKLVGKPTMFMPLSVARKAKKKKSPLDALPKTSTSTGAVIAPSQPTVMPTKPPAKPKVSLFSISQDQDNEQKPAKIEGEYVPLLQELSQKEQNSFASESDLEAASNGAVAHSQQDSTYATQRGGAQSLDEIANDLNLSEAARRQLFGRQRGKNAQQMSAVNVINFNTDAEYAANEELRAKGETVVHNPVRAIAPGKHSLQQLVSAASNQREALEESFASGRRNKKEAGSKYGW